MECSSAVREGIGSSGTAEAGNGGQESDSGIGER